MKFKKIKFKKRAINLEKLSRRLAENSFLTFFGFLLIVMVLGGLLYYQYVILIQGSPTSIQEKPLGAQEKIYQKILDEWTKRDEKFFQADSKIYSDLFQSPTSTSTEELTE